MTLRSPTHRLADCFGRTRRAFTLVEVVVSLAIMSILIMALGSTLILASNALPSEDDPALHVIDASRGANSIAEELRTAIHITERSTHAITFTVADRNGDGIWERIRYAWSGTAGDPVTRQYNNSNAVAIIDNVHQFDLAYELETVTEEYPGPVVESDEIELASYDAEVSGKDYIIKDDDWIGQYIQPLLPANAVSWSVTRLLFRAKSDGADDGSTFVQLRPPDSEHKPMDTVLEQHTMYEDDLNWDYTWREFSFSNVADLAPDAGLCLVLKWGADATAANIRYDNQGGSGRLKTSDAGASWTYWPDKALRYYVYGKVTAHSGTIPVSRQHVTAVHATVQAGDCSDARVETAVQTLNRPEALSAVWELDFNGDPITVDLNGDGDDWTESEAPFDPETLSDGIWYCPDASYPDRVILQAMPGEDFAELTTVEYRGRTTSADGFGACVRINADRTSSSECAPIYVTLWNPNDSTHQLWIGYSPPGGGFVWLDHYDVHDDFVDVRLVIDPATDMIAVFADGEHKGSYFYEGGADDPTAAAWIYTSGASGEFDHVRIRVGGGVNNP